MTMSTSPLAIESSSSRRRWTPPAISLDMTMVRAVGKTRRDLFGEPLDTRPDGDQAVDGTAGGTSTWPPFGVAAMVAEEDAAEAMFDQPGRAVRALETVAAGPAEGQRRVAAPVEKEKRLLFSFKGLRDRLDHRRRQEAAALGRVGAQIHRPDFGQFGGGVTVVEDDPPIPPGVGVNP